MAKNSKARFWTGVLYPENMVESWESDIGDLLELPYAYCIHTADVDSKSEHRKDHVHLVVAFTNTTTYNHALSVFKKLGERAVNIVKPVISIRHVYDYLIHDTEDSRKKGKYLYPKEARITGNGFDIGSYEQISASEKREVIMQMCSHIWKKKFANFADFFHYEMTNAGDNLGTVSEALITHSGLFERLTRGVYQKAEGDFLRLQRLAWSKENADILEENNWHFDEDSGEFCRADEEVQGEHPGERGING